MGSIKGRPQWHEFLRYFGEKNEGRPTRLGVFENGNDYWLEDGLPLVGVDLDPGKADASVQIMLGRFTHTVRSVSRVTFHLSNDGNSDGVDVTDAEGRVAMLRFEKNPVWRITKRARKFSRGVTNPLAQHLDKMWGSSQPPLGTFIAIRMNVGEEIAGKDGQDMKVLVATEGSEFSEAAIDKCCTMLGNSADTEIRIVAASEPTVVPVEPFAMSAEYIRAIDEEARMQSQKLASRAEDEIRSRMPDIGSRLSTTVTSGAPAQVIVDEAERWGADLIVVGSHGYGFWKRALLGSVSNAVVHHAPCSVLVVRGVEPTKEANN